MSDAVEVWLPVPGFEGRYEASNLGRLRSLERGSCLMAAVTNGYHHVTLIDAIGGRQNIRVHVAVLSAFCGEKPFPTAHAAHNNGNKNDNRLANLRWSTPKENQDDVARHGNRCKGERVFGAKLTEDSVRKIRCRAERGEIYADIAADYDVSISTVSLIRLNKIWRHVA